MSRTTKPTITLSIDEVVDAYVSTIDSYIESHNLNKTRAIQALLKRPNSVRVGKVASHIIDVQQGKAVTSLVVRDVFSTEDIYTITNRIYNRFNRVIEPDISRSVIVRG